MKKSIAVRKKAVRPTKPVGRNPVIAGRVPEPLYEKIKAAAAASGRSMSEELAWRVEQAFNTDEVLGGTGMRGIAALMISSFNTAGAAVADIFVAEDEDWRRDRSCFIIGAAAVIENLMAAVPGEPFNPEQIESEVESLALGVRRRLMNQWEKYVARKEEDDA